MEATIKRYLTDKDSTRFYPITLDECVQTTDGKTLNAKIEEKQDKINDLEEIRDGAALAVANSSELVSCVRLGDIVEQNVVINVE